LADIPAHPLTYPRIGEGVGGNICGRHFYLILSLIDINEYKCPSKIKNAGD
jgi:hypothetical protein